MGAAENLINTNETMAAETVEVATASETIAKVLTASHIRVGDEMNASNGYDFNFAAPQQSHNMRPKGDPRADFINAILRQGFEHPGDILPTGKIVRFGRKDECWYVFHEDGIAAGAFGSWRAGETHSWCAKAEFEMSPGELHAHRARIDLMRQAREEETRQMQAEAAGRAVKDWDAARPVDVHPYLSAKGVKSHGLRLHQGKLMIPIRLPDGSLVSYQAIGADGSKRFLPDGRKKGCSFTIQGSEMVGIAEGYATAATIHEAMGWTVLVAFDAGNLLEVARAYRAGNPQAKMVICGDEDLETEGNPGRTKATLAAKEVSARLAIPDLGSKKGDWNDLLAARGADEVRRQLQHQVNPPRLIKVTDWSLDKYAGKAPPREWVVENVLPRGACVVLAAMGGVGKGMMTLDLALKVGSQDNMTHTAFGNRVAARGPVVIFSAEDDQDEIHRRIEGLGRRNTKDVYVIPLPDATGPLALIRQGKHGPEVTPAWSEIEEQVLDLKPVLINFDPMASFVMADINKDPAVGAFTMGLFAHLAKRSYASLVVAHHMAKMKEGITSIDSARGAVRGTSAIVDNARGCYVLWSPPDKKGADLCNRLSVPYKRNKIVLGGLAKNNFPGDTDMKTYLRGENGLLVCVEDRLREQTRAYEPFLLQDLEDTVREWAERLQPFTLTGSNSFEQRREDLAPSLREESRNGLIRLVRELERQGRITKCIPVGSTAKNRYDVPGGPIATGSQKIVPGSGK